MRRLLGTTAKKISMAVISEFAWSFNRWLWAPRSLLTHLREGVPLCTEKTIQWYDRFPAVMACWFALHVAVNKVWKRREQGPFEILTRYENWNMHDILRPFWTRGEAALLLMVVPAFRIFLFPVYLHCLHQAPWFTRFVSCPLLYAKISAVQEGDGPTGIAHSSCAEDW